MCAERCSSERWTPGHGRRVQRTNEAFSTAQKPLPFQYTEQAFPVIRPLVQDASGPDHYPYPVRHHFAGGRPRRGARVAGSVPRPLDSRQPQPAAAHDVTFQTGRQPQRVRPHQQRAAEQPRDHDRAADGIRHRARGPMPKRYCQRRISGCGAGRLWKRS